ncbi:MAG TPA: hypothetical protein VGG32_09635 [Thermoplasmata archaeon]|jgi:hypothetical protein
MSGDPPTTVIYAREWLARFRSQFDEAAGDPRTALGLFYDRHRRFVAGPGNLPPSRPEYSYEEWNRTFATFLASLARDFGLVQAPGWTDVPQLMWFWHGIPDRPAVAIREVKVATDSIVEQDLPSVVRSGALLTVLVIYPDYPAPQGTRSVEEATERWRARIGDELARLGLTREFLLTTISAFDWDLPAPWKGFAWHPSERSMSPVE